MGGVAALCVCGNRCRATAADCSGAGRYLVILAVCGSEPLPVDSAQLAAAARIRLADRIFRNHRWAALSANRNLAVLSGLHFQPGEHQPMGGSDDLPGGNHGGGDGAENIQQCSNPDQAGGAGAAVAASADGGLAEPDQPALFV